MAAIRTRTLLRAGLFALVALLAIPLAYVLAALVGGLVPVNAGWEEPEQGVTLFIRTNGVHTWIMVPAVTPEMDWRPLAPAAHIARPDLSGDYLAIGYGNREFYLNTPRWADLRADTALKAVFGRGRSLVHVEHERAVRADEYQQPLVVTREQYRRLAEHIARSFERDAAGRTKPLIGRGYGELDVFYEGAGPYNAFYTCNEWTGEALRTAGVQIGAWTPLAQSVTWRVWP
jgi:uncharacterized protein (TIGR02117 family)